MKITLRKCVVLLSILTLILGGCSQDLTVSAEEIIHNAIESEKDVTAYQGKAEMKIFEGEEVIENVVLQEYVAEDGKRKVLTQDKVLNQEVEVLNDGERMLIFDKGNGEAMEMDMTELDGIGASSPKEQLKSMIETMSDSHTYEVVGEEKLLDFDTYHIKLTANDAGNLIGDMELWIDQKTWFTVKIISETGDNRTELEYTELDFSPDFAKDTFTLDVPEDVEITDLEESYGPDTVTIEEAEEALGQAILLFSEEDAHLSSVQMYDFSEELDRYEVELTYTSNEEIPLFSMSVFPTPEDMEMAESDFTVRGNQAEYEEMIDGIIWDEDGLRYSVLITNPDVAKEDIVKWTENMKLSSEKE